MGYREGHTRGRIERPVAVGARPAYDIVLLDADDTLFDFGRAERHALQATLAAFGYHEPPAVWAGRFHAINKGVWREYEAGRATSGDIRVRRFALLLEELGHPADPHEMSRHYVTRLGEAAFLLPGARRFVSALQPLVPLGLVTNGIREVQRSRLARSGLESAFSAVVISDEVGIQKPDPRIFRIALESLGSGAGDRVIMIGDNLYSDILGAANAGIDSCWFRRPDEPSDPAIAPTHTARSFADLYQVLGINTADPGPGAPGPQDQER